MCIFRLSETSASSESVYKLYECVMTKTEAVNKLKFFRQIGEEIQRVKSVRESPEIIALVADWGQGKTTLLSILEEIVNVTKLNFMDIIQGKDIDLRNKVVLIDEVETSVEYLPVYRERIKDFWVKIKEIANSKKDVVIYLSMTPSAFSKIFGEMLRELFPETFEAIEQRVKKVYLMPPTKLEFLAVINCLLEFNKLDKKILEYMDLPYWTIGQERRRLTRFFNDVVCKSVESKDPLDMMFKLIQNNPDLNEEGETIRVNELMKFEKELDKEEIKTFHEILMKRIFVEKPIESLKDFVVEGYLVDFYSWLDTTKDLDTIEDFILVYLNEKDSFDQNLYVFLSDEIDKVIYENVNKGNLSEVISKLKVRSKRKAYALTWNLFETLVNTNVGGSVVEFETRELKERAIKFVNEKLLDEEKEVEALISFLRYGMKIEFEEKKVNRKATLLQLPRFNVLITKDPIKLPDDELIHGVILLTDDTSLDSYYNSLSVKILHLPLTTPEKRQLLYINFYSLYEKKGVRLREEAIKIKLSSLYNSISSFLNSINEELTLPSLPLTKGNKRPIPSFNWIVFAPEIYPARGSEVFEKVNEIVNEKFRMFGSKQFHLDDIETAETFTQDVVQYFAENKIINAENNVIDFSNLAGQRVKEFTKTIVGWLRQVLKDKLEDEVIKYLQNVKISQSDEKNTLINVLNRIFGTKKNSSLEFLLYSSIATGEIASYLKVRDKINLREIKERLDKINISNAYFITAKKREAGVRSINDMINTIKTYINLAEKSDDKNFLRFSIVIFTLEKQLNKFMDEISEAEKYISDIKSDIFRKLDLLNKAKRLVGVDKVEEEETLQKLPQIVEEVKKKLIDVIPQEDPENVLNLIETIQKISKNDSNYLDLIVWEITKILIDGANIPMSEKLRDAILPLVQLTGLNSLFAKLEGELNEIEKSSPEIMKLQSQLEEKRKEVQKLIREIKNELGGK